MKWRSGALVHLEFIYATMRGLILSFIYPLLLCTIYPSGCIRCNFKLPLFSDFGLIHVFAFIIFPDLHVFQYLENNHYLGYIEIFKTNLNLNIRNFRFNPYKARNYFEELKSSW